jgi:hypothetical protein
MKQAARDSLAGGSGNYQQECESTPAFVFYSEMMTLLSGRFEDYCIAIHRFGFSRLVF